MHDQARVDAILAAYPRDESSLVMVLQDIQSELRYLPCHALERVAEVLDVPRSRVFSVLQRCTNRSRGRLRALRLSNSDRAATRSGSAAR